MADLAGCPMRLSGKESRLDDAIRANPYPFYRAMRAEAPVYYDPGLDVWLVTRYADVQAVLRDDVNYSLEHGYQDRYANGFVEELAEIMDREGGGFVRDPVFDPPAHTRLRKLLGNAFTAHRVKELEPRLHQIVRDLIADIADKGRCDAVKDIAIPLTIRVIVEQLGLDHGIEKKISEWSMAVTARPACRATPLSRYQASSLMTMSAKAFSPASTGESMIRL